MIKGAEYPWDSIAPDTYTDALLDDNDAVDSSTWITTKRLQFWAIPRVWLLHVERPRPLEIAAIMSNINEEVAHEIVGFSIDVPIELQPQTLDPVQSTNAPYRLTLQGAILQVVEPNDEDVQADENMEVHCVALLRTNNNEEDSHDDESWILIDDDKLQSVTKDRAMRLLNGSVEIKETNSSKSEQAYYGATLLVYSIASEEEQTDWNNQVDEVKSASNPFNLVGRRLRVKWAKGKFYAGKITNYNKETGKHTVEYDDGDVKEYVLSKKTIEWLKDD